MADTETTPQEETVEQESQQEGPQGTERQDSETDWKAKYEELKAQSRKWESRAKRNEAAAKELDEVRQSQMSDAEKAADAEKRAEEAEAAKQAAEAKLARMSLVQKVSSEKNVPAALLKGDTEEELDASADALLAFAGSIPPQIPPDQGGAGKTPPISKESLKDIKNPIERIKAREALNSLV